MFDIQPINHQFLNGVEVVGLDLDKPMDEATMNALRELWLSNPVVLFRGVCDSAEKQLMLSEVFGTLKEHPIKSLLSQESNMLIDIKSGEKYGKGSLSPKLRVNGVELCHWLPWHKDTIYDSDPIRGGILRAIDVPGNGEGKTGFINCYSAYDELPEHQKQRIDGLRVTYSGYPDFENVRYQEIYSVEKIGENDNEKLFAKQQVWPDNTFPLALKHPLSGNTSLNTTALYFSGIVGMEPVEAAELFQELLEHATQERFAYYHDWQPNDLIMWDNWCVMHAVPGHAGTINRYMQRSSICSAVKMGAA